MTTGRTTINWSRVYADGYDLSGYARKFGPLTQEFEATALAALSDGVKNVVVGVPTLGIGTLTGFFDNTATSGLHVVASGAGTPRTVMVALGIQAVPAQGDPAYCGIFEQSSYHSVEENEYVTAALKFGATNGITPLAYVKPWGVLLLPKSALSSPTVNTATGVDDNGASSALGGFAVYQGFSGNGTATLKIQDAATNTDGSFADLSGATTGSLNWSTPQAGLIALGTTATVRRYLRYQIVWGTATAVTLALAFVRALF